MNILDGEIYTDTIGGNGYAVYYDAKLDGNKALGGKTYTLAKGGKLTPK